jgi:hypothetical protein
MELLSNLFEFLDTLEARIYWHFILAGTFLLLAVLMVVIIFLSRLVKRNRDKEKKQLKNQINGYINAIAVNDFAEENSVKYATYRYNMDKLFNICNSSWKRQVLIDQLLELRKNLLGSSAIILEKIYKDLLLDKHSYIKFTSAFWNVNAKGIKEISTFNCNGYLNAIMKFITSKNSILKNEAYFALIQLHENNPLAFLDDYKGQISSWMELNIYHKLLKKDQTKQINFSRLYNSSNQSVVLFAIKMTEKFRQFSALSSLGELIQNPNAEIKWTTVRALGNLEAYEYAERIAVLCEMSWMNSGYSKIWLKTMSKIGDKEQHKAAIIKFIQHPDILVRLEAARTITNLGIKIEHNIKINYTHEINKLFDHVNNPLLKT